MNPLINVKNAVLVLRSQKEDQQVLGSAKKGLDFTLTKNEHVAILGANGAGKSTLLKLLNGSAWLKSGSVTWFNKNASPDTSRLVGKEMTALVSSAQQEKYMQQAWNITGRELIQTGFADSPLLYTLLQEEQEKAIDLLAEELCISPLLTEYIPTLSQGQLRLLLLARALVRKPQVVLLDEYTDGLDGSYRAHILQILERKAKETTFVFTTHREETLPKWVQKKFYLKNGVLSSEVPEKGESPILFSFADEKSYKEKTVSEEENFLIEVEKADVYIDRTLVLHDITWKWKQGEHWCISGANGSGKSTFLKLLAGEEYPALGGSITRYLPHYKTTTHNMEHVRNSIRLISDKQQALYSYDCTAFELVLSGFDNTVGIYRDFTEEEKNSALEKIKFLDMQKYLRRHISTLSTGQLRRLLLARALLGPVDMLLLDEACSGLDKESRHQLLTCLDNITEMGIHLVFVSHHMSDFPKACTRSAKIEKGHLYIER